MVAGNIWTIFNKALGRDGTIDASGAEKDATILFSFHGKPNQEFALEPLAPGTGSYVYLIKNIQHDKYLQLSGKGLRVTLVPKDTNNKKTQFAFAEMNLDKPPEPQSMLKQGEQYKIICVENNLVLDGAKGQKQVWGFEWHGGDNQTWELENMSGNIWTIFNKALGRDGTIDASGVEKDATILFAFHGQPNQQFALEPLYPGSYVHFIRNVKHDKYLQLNGKGSRVTFVSKDYNNKKTQFVFAEMDLTRPKPVPEIVPEPKPDPEKAPEPKPVPEKAPEPKPVPEKEPEPEVIVKPGEEDREIRFGDDEVLDGSKDEVKLTKKRDTSDQIWHFNESKTGYKITIHYPTQGKSKVLCQENGKLVLKESDVEKETQTWKFVPTSTGSFEHFLVHSETGNVIQNNGIGNELTVVPKDPSNPKQKCSSTPKPPTRYTVVEHKPATSAYTIVYKKE